MGCVFLESGLISAWPWACSAPREYFSSQKSKAGLQLFPSSSAVLLELDLPCSLLQHRDHSLRKRHSCPCTARPYDSSLHRPVHLLVTSSSLAWSDQKAQYRWRMYVMSKKDQYKIFLFLLTSSFILNKNDKLWLKLCFLLLSLGNSFHVQPRELWPQTSSHSRRGNGVLCVPSYACWCLDVLPNNEFSSLQSFLKKNLSWNCQSGGEALTQCCLNTPLCSFACLVQKNQCRSS